MEFNQRGEQEKAGESAAATNPDVVPEAVPTATFEFAMQTFLAREEELDRTRFPVSSDTLEKINTAINNSETSHR